MDITDNLPCVKKTIGNTVISVKNINVKGSVEFCSPSGIEKLFGIKCATVRSWIRQRRIKGFKIGKLVLINISEFRERFSRYERGEDFFDVP
jgi:hypothetical protein